MNSGAKRPAALVAAFCLSLVLVLLPAAQASADPYTDESSHPLALVHNVVHPVTKALEWVVFRPLHLLGHLLAPDDHGRDQRSRECRSVHRRPHRECRGI